jgi:hypothetical protein
MVDGLTESSSFLSSSVMQNGFSKKLICSRMNGASIFPHLYEKNAHTFRREITKSPEYFGFLPPPFFLLRWVLSFIAFPSKYALAVFPQFAKICVAYFLLYLADSTSTLRIWVFSFLSDF